MLIEKMKQDIRSIFLENCDFIDEEMLDSLKLEDLGIHSILFVRIIVMLEKQFCIEFEDQDLEYTRFQYMEDVYNYVASKAKII